MTAGLYNGHPPVLDDGPHIPADSGDVGSTTRNPLIFRTARDLSAMTTAEIEYAAAFLAFGAITELDGRPKAAGKTTFVLELIRARLDGLPFLGKPTRQGPVVMLSEQPPASLRASLERAGLADRDDLYLLTWSEAAGTPWSTIVAAAADLARSIGCLVLVVDTLPQFAGLRGDSENNSGSALEAIEPLQLLAAEGFAVLVTRHDRKGGGDVGESARGSGAFTGAVDIVLALSHDAHDLRPTMRRLLCLSRFDLPADLMLEMVDGRYVALGSIDGVRATALSDLILGLLPGPGEEPVEPREMTEAAGKDETTIKQALRAMLAGYPSRVLRSGKGHKGDPFRWSRAAANADSPVSTTIHHLSKTAPDAGFLSGAPLRGEQLPERKHSAARLWAADPDPEEVDAAIAAVFPWPGEASA